MQSSKLGCGPRRAVLLATTVAFAAAFAAGVLTTADRRGWATGSAALLAGTAGRVPPPPPLRAAAPSPQPSRQPVLPPPVPAPAPAPAAIVPAMMAPPAPSSRAPSPVPIEVRRGDTLADILDGAGLDGVAAQDAITTLRARYDPRQLRPGQSLVVSIEPGSDGTMRLSGLTLDVDAGRSVRLARDAGDVLVAQVLDRPLRRAVVRAAGTIDGSLYAAATAAALPQETLAEAIRVLSWDVDFQRDVHPGDGFEVVYARLTNDEDEEVGAEAPMFVGLELRGRAIAAYRFTDGDGVTSYYDADGNALRKWLLRTPVDGARLASRFGARRHPILGYTRMHKGIDFAAPTGTPIFAAGDGTVEMAGRNRGYGNYVRIRHGREFATAYAHLSRFADGLERGHKVRQGEVIGAVGSTGMSTGPHLHYEVLRDGQQINPLSLKAEFAQRLEGRERPRFLAARAAIEAARRQPTGIVVARDY